MNTILYARVSTEKQADKDLSLPAQLQAMRDYARQHGMSVVQEFIEPGVSAKTAERPALKALLSLVRTKEANVEVVLVHKIDRLARNVYDHAMIRGILKEHGARLTSVVENIDESVSGQLVENIMASIAEFYSANLSEEVKKGMKQKVLRGGWPHRPPRGYVVVKSTAGSSIEIHPQDAPLMKKAFELYSTGWYSLKALSARLAKEGLLGRNGGAVSEAHLRRLLENPFYVGRVRWHDLERPGAHGALISRALFDQVQGVIRQRYKNPGPKGSQASGFPLRGLAICASCRGRMTSEAHGKWRYYRCSRQTYRRDLCPARFCNAARAHVGIERICRQLKIDRQLANEIASVAQKLIDARTSKTAASRADANQELARLLVLEQQLTESFTAGDLTPSDYQVRVADLRSRREGLAAAQRNPRESADQLAERVGRFLQLATSFWDVYQSLQDGRRHSLLRVLFSSVVLDHTGVAGFTLRRPFADLLVDPGHMLNPEEVVSALLDAA